jgi:UvrD-like helicase C-terminal domain/AAA domain/Ankyrin repeat
MICYIGPIMDTVIYNELDASRVKKQYDKIIDMIRRDDFYSSDVKKLSGTPYYRAKLDHSNRLLFKVVEYNQKKYALILEVIHNHEYEKSRFLNGAKIDENKLELVKENELAQSTDFIFYVNHENHYFHLLDKIISFDSIQEDIFSLSSPLIIVGSAGSGKTMLTLEKMKTCPGEVLYITGSPYLVQNARHLYYANQYSNDAQEIEFLSYREFLETIRVPIGKEIDFQAFSQWLLRMNRTRHFQDANKLYEEFKGVISGNTLDKSYLSREHYIKLGIKQSIYSVDERNQVYDLFEKYLIYLRENQRYDSNLISYDYITQAIEKYNFIVVDEVQDFTPIQLSLILKTLKCKQQFILCGDSNQIVHPNFFSWSKIKSLFYGQSTDYPAEIMRILNKNYRNSPNVTAIANKILKIKNVRFGSIDKESHYLVESQSKTNGNVYCLFENDIVRNEINNKTRKSTHFAVIVLRDELKDQVRRYFQTPLIFSIHEAKGLEYENVILYNFISSDENKFRDIARGIEHDDIEGELVYGRVKDKTDRSLEIYKFFINALYVAITRAVKNVYFIENIEQHSLLSLLGLNPTTEFIAIESRESSLDDWQKEATKLEMQGKQSQADAIRNTILHTPKTPWQVVTLDYLIALREKALDKNKKDKAARLLLFEYAMHYHQPRLFEGLAEVGFIPALKPKKDYDLLERKYFIGYSSSNTSSVMRQVTLYGVDFRNIFNQTPLMIACHFGNHLLVKQLMEKGANPNLTDNAGRNAFQITLQKAFLDKRFAKEKLAFLHECLLPDDISLQVDDRLIKIDVHRMEFFLVNAVIAITYHRARCNHLALSFKVADFLEPLTHFPEMIIPERRKQRPYISSILAKNEIDRQDIYNKKLFLRVKHGHYVFNPKLMLRIEGEWVSIYKLLNLEST